MNPALRRSLFVLVFALPPSLFVAAHRHGGRTQDVSAHEPRGHASDPETSFDRWDASLDPRTRLLVVGGGGEPSSTEVQLEQDVALALDTLRGPAVVLFGGGPSRASVHEQPDRPDEHGLFAELSRFFLRRTPSQSPRPPRIRVDAPATYDNLMHAFDELVMASGEPLTLLLATHGEFAPDPQEGYALLWGNEALIVQDLVDLLGQPSTARPVRLVVGACFGGAFAEVAALPPRGVESTAMHCGVFATDADRLASGCDPDPDRERHEGYLIHYLHALGGRDRLGRVAPSVDLDHDGRIGMLEAHTFARVASRSFDVPITTSERFVRSRVTERELPWESTAAEPLLEEREVIRALSHRLDAPTEAVARAAHRSAAQSLEECEEALAEADAMRESSWNRLRVALLERHPWLEDAYAIDYASRVRRERAGIEALLLHSELAQALRETSTDADAIAAEADALRIREAELARLVRAYDLERMVATLRARDAEGHARYLALRECERFVPATGR